MEVKTETMINGQVVHKALDYSGLEVYLDSLSERAYLAKKGKVFGMIDLCASCEGGTLEVRECGRDRD